MPRRYRRPLRPTTCPWASTRERPLRFGKVTDDWVGRQSVQGSSTAGRASILAVAWPSPDVRIHAEPGKSQRATDRGTATFGVLRNADFYLGSNLAKRFHALYPDERIRLVGQNSAETASDVASGFLEAGLVTLPVDDTELDVVPLVRDEVLFVVRRPNDAASL